MNLLLWYGLAAAFGYLLGCSNMAYYLSRAAGIDLKNEGTGNYGTSNALVVMGKKAALYVLLHDILKGTIAIVLIRMFLTSRADAVLTLSAIAQIAAITGAFAILGHMFPFYMKGGGKGFATYIGAALGIDWRWALFMILMILLVVFITDYIVSGTFFTIAAVPVFLGIRGMYFSAAVFFLVSSIILYKHRINIRHILDKSERRVRAELFKKR